MIKVQEEAKALIEKCMAYAKEVGLQSYRVQFMAVWDIISGYKTDKTKTFEWLGQLKQTEVIERLVEILKTEQFPKLGLEAIFMGEIVNA